MELKGMKERTLMEWSLLDLRLGKQSRHLEPCPKISEGMSPLEAHHWHTR